MKKITLLITAFFLLFSVAVFPQSRKKQVEVLYFKAKQCACRTRVCNALENQVKLIIEKNFADENIIFKRVWLNNKENTALIEKYQAKSQTVVLVKTKRKKEWSTDLTGLVKNLTIMGEREKAETDLINKIAENL